jgi:hypothetical protein
VLYESVLRPLLFTLSPSSAHDLGLGSLALLDAEPLADLAGRVLGPVPSKPVQTMGLTFPHPVGLAGGFDKNARAPRALEALGFGFLELGTVTAKAQEPNPAPNLFRLPQDHALINRLGFPNEGAAAVAARIASHRAARPFKVPVGVSIGKSRVVSVDDESLARLIQGAACVVVESSIFAFSAASYRRCRAMGSVGKTIAQGTSAGRPYSSALTKLASLPKKSPSGTPTATLSPKPSGESFCARQNSQAATITPRAPPWKAMPPCQTMGISHGAKR